MKKPQWVKCDMCGVKIQREQGEDRTCVNCSLQLQDGADIDNEYYD